MIQLDLKHHIAHIAEDKAIADLERRGFDVHSNGYHDHADLILNGTLRVEVKGSLWVSQVNRKGRYQFNTRNHPDVYLLYCLGELGRAFIIPQAAIENRRNIAIWSEDPTKYTGMWSQYLEAWDVLEKELVRCQE